MITDKGNENQRRKYTANIYWFRKFYWNPPSR